MSGGEVSGPGQEDGNGDGRQKPQEGAGAEQRRLPAQDEIDGKDAKRDQTGEEMGGNEGLLARRIDNVTSDGVVHERAEIASEPAETLTTQHAHPGADRAARVPDCIARDY